MKKVKNRAPEILDFIATVAALRLKKNVDAQVPLVCMACAMMMNQRRQELIAWSRELLQLFLELDIAAKRQI